VEAIFGLGEALVSDRVNADVDKVRDGDIVAKAVATKKRAIHASPTGGTQEQPIEPAQQVQPALTDGLRSNPRQQKMLVRRPADAASGGFSTRPHRRGLAARFRGQDLLE
jgi:phosphoenolpyruvate synthase/pyruvate phosphate dikinase